MYQMQLSMILKPLKLLKTLISYERPHLLLHICTYPQPTLVWIGHVCHHSLHIDRPLFVNTQFVICISFLCWVKDEWTINDLGIFFQSVDVPWLRACEHEEFTFMCPCGWETWKGSHCHHLRRHEFFHDVPNHNNSQPHKLFEYIISTCLMAISHCEIATNIKYIYIEREKKSIGIPKEGLKTFVHANDFPFFTHICCHANHSMQLTLHTFKFIGIWNLQLPRKSPNQHQTKHNNTLKGKRKMKNKWNKERRMCAQNEAQTIQFASSAFSASPTIKQSETRDMTLKFHHTNYLAFNLHSNGVVAINFSNVIKGLVLTPNCLLIWNIWNWDMKINQIHESTIRMKILTILQQITLKLRHP